MGLRKINTIGIKQANKQRITFYLFQLKERILLQISIFKRIENLDFKLI